MLSVVRVTACGNVTEVRFLTDIRCQEQASRKPQPVLAPKFFFFFQPICQPALIEVFDSNPCNGAPISAGMVSVTTVLLIANRLLRARAFDSACSSRISVGICAEYE